MFPSAGDPRQKVHDNSIFCMNILRNVMERLVVGAVHSPQIYNVQLSVE